MTLSDFTRLLYRGKRPNWIARILNRVSAVIHSLGIAPSMDSGIWCRCWERTSSGFKMYVQQEEEQFSVVAVGRKSNSKSFPPTTVRPS